MDVNGNTAAIVDDRDAVIDVNGHFDRIAMTGKRFVDGVIDDFINKMVQTTLASVADIHSWSLVDRFQAFQNFYVVGVISRAWWSLRFSHFHLTKDLILLIKLWT